MLSKSMKTAMLRRSCDKADPSKLRIVRGSDRQRPAVGRPRVAAVELTASGGGVAVIVLGFAGARNTRTTAALVRAARRRRGLGQRPDDPGELAALQQLAPLAAAAGDLV